MKDIIDIFEEKVLKKPQKIAVVSEKGSLTYKELQIYSERLAYKMKNEYGVGPGTIIPVLFSPSIEMVVSLFAIFKLGCAYLPISTEFPKERQEILVEISESSLLLSNIPYVQSDITVLNLENYDFGQLEDNVYHSIKEERAYLLFTSGSTGVPKGVEVSHENLMYILVNMQKYYPVHSNDKYLLGTPYTFDVSVTELFGWIMGEGSLVISGFETKNSIKQIYSVIQDNGVTHMALSPSLLNVLLKFADNQRLAYLNNNLKFLMIAGEEFPAVLAKQVLELLPDVTISNLYGPTETTVYATHYVLSNDMPKTFVPIGKEFDDAEIHLIDQYGNISVEDTGEILICGIGVSEGYYNNPKMTKEKFITIQVNNKCVYGYKSGDLGKRDEHGNIIYLGRIDNQVQVNGIRVEVGEIENVTMNHPNINNTIVIYDNKLLHCLYTLANADQSISENDLKVFLEAKLPKYMVPHKFIRVDSIPINTSGKADRKELLAYIHSLVEYNVETHNLSEFSEQEMKLKQVLENIIHKDILTRDWSLFDLGVDSLTSLEIELALEEEYELEVENGFLFHFSTVSEINEYLKMLDNSKQEKSIEMTFSNSKEVNLISKLKKCLKKNSMLTEQSEPIKTYESFIHQKRFIHTNFDTYICTSVPVFKSAYIFNEEQLVHKVVQFIDKIDMFKSWLSYDSTQKLNFHVMQSIETFEIPVFDVCNVNDQEISRLESVFIAVCEERLKQKKLGALPYQIFILNEAYQFRIVFVMDHNISDFASRHIITRQLINFLKGESVDYPATYDKYIDYIKEKNDSAEILTYIQKVDEANQISEKKLKLSRLDNHIKVIKSSWNNKKVDNMDIISEVVYKVGEITSEYFESDTTTMRVIMNLRNFADIEFNKLIGDCHTCTYFIHESQEEKSEFDNRFKKFVNDFHYEKAINFNYLANKNYPNFLNEEEMYYQKVLFKDFPVDINFIGQMRKDELYAFLKGSEEENKTIGKLGFNIILAVAAICNNELYICFMSNVPINTNTKEKLEVEEVDITKLQLLEV